MTLLTLPAADQQIANSLISVRDRKVVAKQVGKMLKVLEGKLKLEGFEPDERYRWDKESIIESVAKQVSESV